MSANSILPIHFHNISVKKSNLLMKPNYNGLALFRRKFLPLLHRANVRYISADDCAKIGNREVVGFGWNGNPEYADRTDFPFPSIRWKETTSDLCCLREKEKGDWKKLSLAEKKELYRWSFRHTYSEITAPSGEWKGILGAALIICNIGVLWWYVWYHKILLRYNDLPPTFSDKRRAIYLRRVLDMENNPIEGIASKWDYEKNDWKPGYAPKN